VLHIFTLNGSCHNTKNFHSAKLTQNQRVNNADQRTGVKRRPWQDPEDTVKASGSKGAPSTTTTSYAKAIGKQKPETVSAPPSGTTSPAVMLGLTDLDKGINTPLSDQRSLLSFLDDGLNTAFSSRLDRASARINLLADRYAEQQAIAMRADARMEAHIVALGYTSID